MQDPAPADVTRILIDLKAGRAASGDALQIEGRRQFFAAGGHQPRRPMAAHETRPHD